MNVLLLLFEILCYFSLVVVFDKFFGKYGMYAWVAIASILANLQTAKQVCVLGLNISLGGVLFSSIYLATDILVEKYTFEDSKRAVYIGLVATLTYLVSMYVCCLWTPNMFDYVSAEMNAVFQFSPRICLSSVVMFFLSNLLDVHLFHSFKQADGNKKLWKRNNVSTIICNCSENFLFIMGAFLGIYSFSECIMIAVSTSIIELIIALCDTPFLYFAVKNKK